MTQLSGLSSLQIFLLDFFTFSTELYYIVYMSVHLATVFKEKNSPIANFIDTDLFACLIFSILK